MNISNEFLTAVEEKDTLMIKIMLKDSLIVDPTFKEFDELLDIAEKAIPDIYDEHNGEVFESDISMWNKDYMDEQMVNLLDNFSKERITLLKNICKLRYSERAEEIKKQRLIENNKKTLDTQKQIGIGIAAGGAAIAVAGLVASKPVVVGIGAVAAIAGGILIAADK